MNGAKRKMLTPTNTVQMQLAMMSTPQSLKDLSLASGLAMPTVTRFVRELQSLKAVHVGDWARDARGYPTIEQYTWGPGVNAVCPRKNETSAVRMAAIRAKKKVVSAAINQTKEQL